MSLKVFHFGVQLHFQFLRRKLFPLTFVLCAQYCLPSDTALTVLKDLAKHNCGWRQTNMSVTLWVRGFSVVVGIARKDLRNVCEFYPLFWEKHLYPSPCNMRYFKLILVKTKI